MCRGARPRSRRRPVGGAASSACRSSKWTVASTWTASMTSGRWPRSSAGGPASSSTRARRFARSLVKLDGLGLGLPLLRVVPDDEAHAGAGLDVGEPVWTLGHVEEEGLALAIAHEAEPLFGEEPVHDPAHAVARAKVDARVLQRRQGRGQRRI